MQLAKWVEDSPFQWRDTHELEQPEDPLVPESELVLDLYLPVEDAHVSAQVHGAT